MGNLLSLPPGIFSQTGLIFKTEVRKNFNISDVFVNNKCHPRLESNQHTYINNTKILIFARPIFKILRIILFFGTVKIFNTTPCLSPLEFLQNSVMRKYA